MSRFHRISQIAVTGSTNDDMAAMLGEEHARGLTLVADYQEHGSGRKGRAWIAQPGTALLCTIALPDAIPASALWLVPFWTAVVVWEALRDAGAESTLQWPNDVLLAGKKVAGILCISRVTGEYAWAGCGIGVNVRRPSDAGALAEISPPPAFVSDDADVERDALLDAILARADARYDDLDSPERIVRAWETAARLPGMRYRIHVDGEAGAFDATALRLLQGGALLVECSGEQREISLADARVLR